MPPRQRNPRALRKHVTTACTQCRDSKVKCDGETPTCSNCRNKGRLCCYQQRDDKRKVPVRVAVGLLARRVDSLVEYIRNAGLPVPKPDEHSHLVLKGVLDALELKCDDLAIEPTQVLGGTEDAPLANPMENAARTRQFASPTVRSDENGCVASQRTVAASPCLSAGNDTLEGTSHEILSRLVEDQPSTPEVARYGADRNKPVAFDPESDDEVTDQFSCRLGRLQRTHDGQLRYFGSLSNLTLLDALVGAIPPASVQKDTTMLLENANLDKEPDEGFERHLLELFFAWQDPSLYVIHPETFWKSRAQSKYEGKPNQYYSRALSDAMCALGAAYESKYHPEFVAFPRSLAEYFGDRAKLLLELEFDCPSVTTVQTLVLLSNHEAACTEDTRGWLYSGMAMRLSLDLGLHLEMSPYIENGTISHQDAEVRRMVFWGVYLNEQFWGFYLGRSPQSRIDAVTVQKPLWPDPLPSIKWKPYPNISPATHVSVPSSLLCRQWIGLYEIMLPLTDILYGCSEISKHALQQLTATTVDRLRSWRVDLSPELGIDKAYSSQSPLPHVLILHMQYHQFMIHCHRPYISKRYIQPQPPRGPGPKHARRMCVESAIAIVELLGLYERAYGFRRASICIIYYIFSATLILIFTTVPSRYGSHEKLLMNHLGTCFRALDEMSACFENAKRTSAFLRAIQQQWHVRRQNWATRERKRTFEDSRRDVTDTSRSLGVSADPPRFVCDELPLAMDEYGPSLDLGVDGLMAAGSLLDESSNIHSMDHNLCSVLFSEGVSGSLI
ncbi:hypothetical protein AARAC_007135 [Aspergillus arachidicola]|uniref:Zn(2)-C6 fungal-type domain-containing protein n=1 Tax=Aspergillus arachidicola TaxID=656916 RepID=A0A2G7FYK3_9EURO|nr:hypothetical protein AARAC_007135 [Aspergillus arachidicola]